MTPLGAQEGPRTLRVDYHHTGGQGVEIFSLDRVVIEPLPWPGHPEGRLDDTGWGAYRFRVFDPKGTEIYSLGFGSIFDEWTSTAEATTRHRTFHESLRFPEPEGVVTVVVEKRGLGHQPFDEVWRTEVDPAGVFVDTSNPHRLEAIEIDVQGPPTSKVDLLFLGDGYTAEECVSKFQPASRELAEALFAHEPFRSRRSDFNIWGLCPPAKESGVSRPSTGIHRPSPIGARYDAFGSERYILTFENRSFRDVAAWAPYEFVEILVNGEIYGGGGIFNLYATVAAHNDFADYIFVHEFGHHFAGLADEYYTSPVAYESPGQVDEPWMANVTALFDPDNLKWGDLVAEGTPLPTPWPKAAYEEHARDVRERRRQIRAENRPESEMSALFAEQREWEMKVFSEAEHSETVGAFQGANYDAEAFFRPEIDCVMFSRNPVPFCSVCSRTMERVIDRYAPRDAR
ncbi:MAG: IgA Peptidase M64 [Thermoanaerobaculia bacterium]|nr:IgA Peptidase M64 [Thermoanaerobaculia bacterium]